MGTFAQVRSRNEGKLKSLYEIKGKNAWEKKNKWWQIRNTSKKKWGGGNREIFAQDEMARNVELSYDTAPFNFTKLTIEKLESYKLHYLKNYMI